MAKSIRKRSHPVHSTENITVVDESVHEYPSTLTCHRSRTSLMQILQKEFELSHINFNWRNSLRLSHKLHRIAEENHVFRRFSVSTRKIAASEARKIRT